VQFRHLRSLLELIVTEYSGK